MAPLSDTKTRTITRRTALLSIGASLATLALKFSAFGLTGSVGLFSDAAESFVNLTASLVAFIMLGLAFKPADKTHTYGHNKAEYFSSGVEGVLIFLAALSIVLASVNRFLHPQELRFLGPGLAVALIAAGVNLVVARIMLKVSRQYDSIILEADAKHLMTDVWTSVGLVLGLGVLLFAPPSWSVLDPILAVLVALNVLYTGFELINRSFHGLMDVALPKEELKLIDEAIRSRAGENAKYHGLRTRKAGSRRFIDFHLLVSGRQTVKEAHDLCTEIETAIGNRLKRTQTTIHVEPEEDGDSWDGSQVGGMTSGDLHKENDTEG